MNSAWNGHPHKGHVYGSSASPIIPISTMAHQQQRHEKILQRAFVGRNDDLFRFLLLYMSCTDSFVFNPPFFLSYHTFGSQWWSLFFTDILFGCFIFSFGAINSFIGCY